MKNIVLIGMMGCGKTTIGNLLSTRLNRPLLDTDIFIEQQEGMSIPDIFAIKGEPYFRSLEMGVTQALSLREGLIIPCGGGLPMQEKAMAPLKETGIVVWLDRDAGEIFDTEDLSDRPLAQQGREAFVQRAAQRRSTYRYWADLIITDFTSPVSTAARVLEGIQ